jgi:GntR family transcriptional regulator
MTPSTEHERITNELRAAIVDGIYPPGSTLPHLSDLVDRYGVSHMTVRRAIEQLEAEGLVHARRRHGTVVRPMPDDTEKVIRSRQMHRDDFGYYSDVESVNWRGLGPTVVRWGPAPADVARLLDVELASDVLIRDRLVGAGPREPRQIATSYLHPEVARGTILSEVSTGPGGIYDRLEEMGHGPLKWRELISARPPSAEEAQRLRLLPGTPLLRVARVSTSSLTDGVVDVTVFLMSAATYAIEHPISRAPSARWPIAPASDPNVPFPEAVGGDDG